MQRGRFLCAELRVGSGVRPQTIQRRYAAHCAMQQRWRGAAGPARYVHLRRGGALSTRGWRLWISKRPAAHAAGLAGETYVLVYNGELYNTPELRAALPPAGTASTGT